MSEDNDHNTFRICSKPQGCKKTGDSECKCFVVAMHVKLNDDGAEEITEEEAYPGARDRNLDDLLSIEKEKTNYPKKGVGHENDYWKVECRCLEVDTKAKPVKD